MDHIPRVSEALYVGLCRQIGTPTEVTVRRNVLDIKEEIEKPLQIHQGLRSIISGSYREGFRLKSSDIDYMFWPTDHKVICDMAQSMSYQPPRHTLIFMDTTDTSPGFATLQLLTQSRNQIVNSSVLNNNNLAYISSSLYRSYWHELVCGLHNQTIERQMMHGPCHTYSHSGFDVDIAQCFHSCHWPLSASSWISRCSSCTWPSRSVLQTIVSEGCHLVPIGSKLSSSQDLEWRISFSQAEKNLVYSMNHVQYVCYGLMKITLNEILCDELLCSYFMKSILFWKILENESMIWNPDNLIQHFWICYKFLLHCVYTEYLPNFFIPENNMIEGKIVGSNKMVLLQKLGMFYELGFAFLLHSPSIREILVPALSDPLFVVNTSESHIKVEVDLDIDHYTETDDFLVFPSDNFHNNLIYLNSVDKLLNRYQSVILNTALVRILLPIALTLKKYSCSSPKKNKHFYSIDKSIISMLVVVSKIDSLSDILHLALYLYDSGRYCWALTVTENARQKLSEPHVLYNGHVDRQRYSEAMGGQSLLAKMKKAWAKDIVLKSNFSYIDELKLEQQVRAMNGFSSLYLSPFVMIHMLSVLCNYRLGNRYRYLQSLTDLHTLLLYDDGRYVHLHYRDISWQILGICQHVVGDLQGALQSYQESLRQVPHHKIQKATETRMHLLFEQLRF